MNKIIGAVCLGKEPQIYGVFWQILGLTVCAGQLHVFPVSHSKIPLNVSAVRIWSSAKRTSTVNRFWFLRESLESELNSTQPKRFYLERFGSVMFRLLTKTVKTWFRNDSDSSFSCHILQLIIFKWNKFHKKVWIFLKHIFIYMVFVWKHFLNQNSAKPNSLVILIHYQKHFFI